MTGDVAVQVAGLRMSFGATEVLHGIDFDVRYGEVFCLLGPNGAGKTTTLEILEGFTAQTDGHVSVLGMNPAAQPARLRERAGMVLQECGFPRQARVAELIDLWRSYYPNPRPLGDLLEVVELTEVRNTQVRKLSGGQRRRLDFALALAGDPDLVFLDEPTTGFDPEARRRCWAAIENLRRLGKTVLLTTHYLDEAEQLADRIAILRAGRIELTGTTHEVAVRAGLATRISFTTPPALRCGQVPPPDGIDLAVRGPESVCHTGNAAMTLRLLLDWARQNSLGDLDGLAVTAPRLEDTYLQLTRNGVRVTRTVRLAVRQALLEQRSFWRSAEYALFTFAFPLMILLLIGAANAGSHLPGTDIKRTTVFVPGILAFGVIVAAYVNLGSKVAVLRHDGVLKRIRTTPLPSGAYIGGLLASTVATVIFITAATGIIGWLAFGAAPRPGELLALAAGLVLGTVCFATLGLAISSVITSAESAGPVAYASFLPIAIISGVFDPTFSGLPDWLSRLVDMFPVKALAEVLQNAYAVRPFPAWNLANLALWTAAGAVFTVWRFRWHAT